MINCQQCGAPPQKLDQNKRKEIVCPKCGCWGISEQDWDKDQRLIYAKRLQAKVNLMAPVLTINILNGHWSSMDIVNLAHECIQAENNAIQALR